ncbi:MAG: membrane protein insertion efficiency factor YidD [Kiritimatiellae bacterium]|nr:membrane protein insertion efficiency factor YidD [Kiritimatiellia bacterium]MDD4737082.1 membrane protein insertion efficiency factor YidD [Kiritimatiellia bacterium]
MNHSSRKNGLCVPALAAGTLFLFLLLPCSYALSNTSALTSELMREEQWTDAWVECNRALIHESANPELRLNQALIQLHRPNGITPALEKLNALQQEETFPQALRNQAAIELGRQALLRDDPRTAIDHFRFAFEQADSYENFLQSGCFLGMTFNTHRELLQDYPELKTSLMTARELWTPALRRECTINPAQSSSPGILSIPGRAVVAFYRFAVSPALGARCSLEPSCSEYFRQASAKHGLLGIPIQADRFMREPSVVSAAEKPVLINGKTRFADPLSDHDFWMKTKTKKQQIPQ